MNEQELLRTHHRDKTRGHITKITPYQLKIVNGVQVYTKGGVSYHADGSVIDKTHELREAKAKAEAARKELAQLEAKINKDSEPVAQAADPVSEANKESKKDEQSGVTVPFGGVHRNGKDKSSKS